VQRESAIPLTQQEIVQETKEIRRIRGSGEEIWEGHERCECKLRSCAAWGSKMPQTALTYVHSLLYSRPVQFW